MKAQSFLITAPLSVQCVSAQFLKPDDPAPLRPGINKGTAENSSAGAQYWYFLGQPGESRITARFKSTGSWNVYPPSITITVYDEKHSWSTSRVLRSSKNPSIFTPRASGATEVGLETRPLSLFKEVP